MQTQSSRVMVGDALFFIFSRIVLLISFILSWIFSALAHRQNILASALTSRKIKWRDALEADGLKQHYLSLLNATNCPCYCLILRKDLIAYNLETYRSNRQPSEYDAIMSESDENANKRKQPTMRHWSTVDTPGGYAKAVVHDTELMTAIKENAEKPSHKYDMARLERHAHDTQGGLSAYEDELRSRLCKAVFVGHVNTDLDSVAGMSREMLCVLFRLHPNVNHSPLIARSFQEQWALRHCLAARRLWQNHWTSSMEKLFLHSRIADWNLLNILKSWRNQIRVTFVWWIIPKKSKWFHRYDRPLPIVSLAWLIIMHWQNRFTPNDLSLWI